MKNRIFLIFLLWGWLFLSLTAQNRVSTESMELTTKTLNDSTNYHSIFSLLSVNNEKNINSLRITVAYRQFIEISGRNVKITWRDIQLSGDIRFRDFDVDSLLIPDRVTVIFEWTSVATGNKVKKRFTAPFPAVNHLFYLSGYKGEKLNVNLQFEVSQKKYNRFVKTVGLVNHYYGFYSVISNILRHKNSNEAQSVCISYLEVHRALYFVEALKLPSVLHLKKNDPKKLLPLLKKAGRYKTREKTLSLKQINRKDLYFDTAKFVRGISNLSEKYLSDEGLYQPYLFASYQLMANLTSSKESVDFFNELCSSPHVKTGDKTFLCRQVFDEFVSTAEYYRSSAQYTFAMILLDNAALWSQMVHGVTKTETFKICLNDVLDGMMTSYLKVAVAGYKSGNRSMGLRYIKKADDLYKKSSLKYPDAVSGFLPQFQGALIRLGNIEIEKNYFQPVLDMIFRFRYLRFNASEKMEIDKLKTLATLGLYNQIIRQAQTALNNGFIDEALQRMRAVKLYYDLNNTVLSNKNQERQKVEKIAYGLILEYIQRGEILLDNNKSDSAMANFGMALKLQNNFLSYRIKRLDTLMNQTAVPVILHEIENTELEVWANKMNEARRHFERIVAFQKKFYLNQNAEVNSALARLQKKLKNRHCVDAAYALSGYLQVVQNRIKLGKWNEAAVAMENAEKTIASNGGCLLDTSLFAGLQYRYRYAFYYVKKYKTVTNNLYAYGYEKVWMQLASLDVYYEKHHLKLFGVPPTGQYQILKSQQNKDNVERVIRYYLSENNSLKAFHYLLLLKKFGVTQRLAKPLQTEVGTAMAARLSPDDFLKTVDVNSEWLQPLIKTYYKMNR